MKLNRILEQTISIAIGIAIAGTAYVFAAPGDPVPAGRIIPYEGYVEIDGVPLNASRGMCFRLYTTPEGGTPFWESDATVGGSLDPLSVTFTQGAFAVNLGETGRALTEQAFSSTALYLGVELASGAACSADRSGELAGRQRLVNPWLAANGPAFIAGSFAVTGSPGTLTVAGNASVGSLNSTGNLTVGGSQTVSGTSTTGAATVNGNQSVTGTSTVTGQVRAQGGLAVTGNQTVSGTSTTGASTVNGTLTLTTDLVAANNVRGAPISVENPYYTTAPGTEVYCPDDTFVCGLRFWYSSTAGHAIPRMICCEL